jgi:hypothetical protein
MSIHTFLEKVCNLISETLARNHFCLPHAFLNSFKERVCDNIILDGFK